MAIGDQVHWTGGGLNTDLRPSSGVEIILKSVTSPYWYSSGSNYYNSFIFRTASSTLDNLVVIGGNAQYTGNGGHHRATTASTSYNSNMASTPINYSYYLRTYGYGGGSYHLGGYITKD